MKKTKAQVIEDTEVAILRKKIGLPPIKIGQLICLICEKKFKSPDTTRVKTCDSCRRVR